MEKYMDKLATLAIFENLSEPELAQTLKCIGGFVKNYEAGKYIVLEGSLIECVGTVISGSVHMVKEDTWGDKTLLAIIGRSQIFGETYVFGDSNKSYVSFVAAEDSEILFLPFLKALHRCPNSCAYHQKLIENMVALIARKNLQFTEKLEITSKRTIRAKVLTYLSQEAQKNNSKYFTVPFGRVEMANYLCADRSALTRELSKMKEEGILDYNNNTFRLLI